MTPQRLVPLYSQAVAYAGLALGVLVLATDTRWVGQVPETLILSALCVVLRGLHIPLSKYSYLNQTGLVALAGSLLVGVPATTIALAGGVLGADWLWRRKPLRAALVNMGREIVSLVAAFGVYAWIRRESGVTTPAVSLTLVPAFFFFVLLYFLISRLLFYFSLVIRDKLEKEEQLLILRYECIAYAATVFAAATVVGTVVTWEPVVPWLVVGIAVTALGLLCKQMLEEAIAAEELKKIHAMEAVITSSLSLKDSFERIDRLANRLVDWGDFRIYRRVDGRPALAYRSDRGRPGRGEPSADTAALRDHVLRSGETVVIDDVTRDERVADASEQVQSLVMVPLRFGEEVIGTLELEHHKRHTYLRKDIITISTFANQLATAIHISELRRPLVETVERITGQLATLTHAAVALRVAAAAVAASTRTIRQGVATEEAEVSGGLQATESLAQVSRRVSSDGAEAGGGVSAGKER
jgi:GAF domain-containing protein